MASPQPSKYTRLSNELLEAIFAHSFTSRELRVVLWIIRNSYGWNRKWAPVKSLRQMQVEIRIDYRHLGPIITALKEAGILVEEGDRWYLVKDYEAWKSVTKKVTGGCHQNGDGGVTKMVTKRHRNGDESVTKMVTDINREVKDRKTDIKTKDVVADKTATDPSPAESVNDRRMEKPPHVQFVERWKLAYETHVPGEVFKFDRHQFVIVDTLIKAHGVDALIRKANTLFLLCKKKSAWFTRDGFADFTLEKLSSMWNSIIPEASRPSKEDEFISELRKQEAIRARIDAAINR